MRWRRHWAALGVTLILGLISNPPAFAQGNGIIVGYVLDDSTQTPLQGANVVLLGTRLGAATDRSGRFQIPGVPPGSYTLEVRFIGYETQTVKVNFVGEPQPVLRIRLRRKN
ncbi:MAG: carboxypeptidase-like regulatory domain-containing protein, partial [Calditrichaeota bacterium]